MESNAIVLTGRGKTDAPVHPNLAILTAILMISTGSILVRFSDAPPNILAFYRVFLAALFIFLINPAKVVGGIKQIEPRLIYISAWSGLFLALHFSTWITALNYTSIANAVTLVDSAPLFALALSHFFLRETASPVSFAGLLVSVAGAAVISMGDFSTDSRYFTGDILAIVGALCMAAYLVCGRVVRERMNLNLYLVLVYGFAACFLGFYCLFTDIPFFDYSFRNYGIFIGLALLPTIGGHSLFLYALRYVKAFLVNLGFLGEPIGATILAFLIFREIPAWHFYIGGFLIVAGSLSALWYEGSRRERTSE